MEPACLLLLYAHNVPSWVPKVEWYRNLAHHASGHIGEIGRGTFEPGWKWSECVKPLAGTDSCQAAHTGYVVSGRMHVVMDDGSEAEVGPGSAIVIPPGPVLVKHRLSHHG